MRRSFHHVAFLLLLWVHKSSCSFWLTKDVASDILEQFEKNENARGPHGRGTDRRSTTPFITGDGFRELCSPHICEDSNRCKMNPADVKNGSCVFIKSDLFEMFMNNVAPSIAGPYVLVTHNGDLSCPDGQSDAPRIGMSRYEAFPIVQAEHSKGRLLSFHGQNLWWRNSTPENGNQPRPDFIHCLPIGFENRQYKVGSDPEQYVKAVKRNIINQQRTKEQLSKRPLLLIAFYPKNRVPDRHKVLSIIGSIPAKGQSASENQWYNVTDLDHTQWLDSISHHKFVLAPFGHGLDTHRISEILLMGGIPVMRRSTISSCFDDSDNDMGPGEKPRGSLPVVILDKWEDLTKERLNEEWEKFMKMPADRWDPARITIEHWKKRIQRIKHIVV